MSPKDEKDGSPHQMKMVIGMVQNSYRVVNQLLSRVEELIMKIDGLHTTVHRLISSDLEATSNLEKNMSIISNLLLIQLSTSLNRSLTQPITQPQFIIPMGAQQVMPSPSGVAVGGSSPAGRPPSPSRRPRLPGAPSRGSGRARSACPCRPR